jgi:threonine/homoserine/homoserine lactone efflux protein
MTIELKHIFLFIALALLLLNRTLQKRPFFVKHGNLIRVLVFLILIAALVMEFLKSQSYFIFVLAALGAIALGWIVYDLKRKKDEENVDDANSTNQDENSAKE